MKTIARFLAWPLVTVLTSGCMFFGFSSPAHKAVVEPAPQVAGSESSAEFQVGDRILLAVEGDTALTDTFTVHTGPAITLPTIGEMPLTGIRRSEVEPYLQDRIAKYVKEPAVHAKALVRIAIEGEVAHPGFYAVPTDIVLSDALMAAGGLTTEAKMSDVRIDRAGQMIMEPQKLQYAVSQGRTIDDLGLRAGDRIYIPRLVRRDAESNFRILAILLTIPVGIYTIMHLK
jgi:polysaccharide export outer membrane protein